MPPSPDAQISVPSCAPNADCGEGFVYAGTFYAIPCVRVRDAFVGAAIAGGDDGFSEIHTITGLPSDKFVAVTGQMPCGNSSQAGWFLAQAEGITPAELDELHEQLLRVTVAQ